MFRRSSFSTPLYIFACIAGMIFIALVIVTGQYKVALSAAMPGDGSIASFEGSPMMPARRDAHIDYSINPAAEKFYVRVPHGYVGQIPYGLIVFIGASDEASAVPSGWGDVLDERQFLYAAPFGAGNSHFGPRRFGMAVLAAMEMMQHYAIDPRRVYVSGISGGARVAGILGFYQPDIFHGTIQNCGADFYAPVPQILAHSETDTTGGKYGLFDATPDEIAGARQTRFALITGSKDFRHGNILDIYNGGFANSGLQVKLFDIPGMGHETASAATLNAALDFLETGR